MLPIIGVRAIKSQRKRNRVPKRGGPKRVVERKPRVVERKPIQARPSQAADPVQRAEGPVRRAISRRISWSFRRTKCQFMGLWVAELRLRKPLLPPGRVR